MIPSAEREEKVSFAFILENNLEAHRAWLLAHCCPPAVYEKGTIITSSGSAEGCLYFLLDGMVKISLFHSRGYERVLGYHRKNTFFAMDSLRGDQPVIVTTTALTAVSALPIPVGELRNLMRLSPRFAEDLLIYYGDVLRLMCYDAESQASGSTTSRLANFIVLFMQSEDYRVHGCLPFTQGELASAIGVSRIQVARVCAALKEEGCVRVEKGRLYIPDPRRLRQLTSFHGFA